MPTIRPSSTVSTSPYRPSSPPPENGRPGQSQSGGNNAGANTRPIDSDNGQHVPSSEFVVPHQYPTVEILNAQNGNGGAFSPTSASGNSSPSNHQSVSKIEPKFQNKPVAGFSGDAQSDGLHLADGKLYAEISGSDDAVLVAYDHDKKNIRAVLEGDTDVTGPTGPIFTRIDPEENVFTFDPKSAIDGNSNIPKNNVEISKNEDPDAISPAPETDSEREVQFSQHPNLDGYGGLDQLPAGADLKPGSPGIYDVPDGNAYIKIDGKWYPSKTTSSGQRYIEHPERTGDRYDVRYLGNDQWEILPRGGRGGVNGEEGASGLLITRHELEADINEGMQVPNDLSQFKATVHSDGKISWKNSSGNTVNNGDVRFIIDKDHNIYLGDVKTESEVFGVNGDENTSPTYPLRPRFHHGSIVGNGWPIYAGRAVVSNGVILSINNHTGHFAQQRSNIEEIFPIFEKNGIDIHRAKELWFDGNVYNPRDPYATPFKLNMPLKDRPDGSMFNIYNDSNVDRVDISPAAYREQVIGPSLPPSPPEASTPPLPPAVDMDKWGWGKLESPQYKDSFREIWHAADGPERDASIKVLADKIRSDSPDNAPELPQLIEWINREAKQKAILEAGNAGVFQQTMQQRVEDRQQQKQDSQKVEAESQGRLAAGANVHSEAQQQQYNEANAAHQQQVDADNQRREKERQEAGQKQQQQEQQIAAPSAQPETPPVQPVSQSTGRRSNPPPVDQGGETNPPSESPSTMGSQESLAIRLENHNARWEQRHEQDRVLLEAMNRYDASQAAKSGYESE